MKTGLKISVFLSGILILINGIGCLSTFETAKVKKGLNHTLSFDLIRIDQNENAPHFTETNYNNLDMTYRTSYGFLLGKSAGFEIGMKFGSYGQSKIGGELVKGSDGKWEKTYIPYESYYSSTIKEFIKVGILQNQQLNLAGIAEFAGADPAVFGVIISKEGEKRTPYLAVKTFNRFLSPAEIGYPETNKWGQIVSAGVEFKTNRKFVGMKKKINILLELGVLNDYWYHDKLSKMIGIGFSLR